MDKQCMILLVANHAGVLARVSSLFCQRGFNIDSLTVSFTDDPAISRITIITHGDEHTFSQIIKQTQKLVETKMIFSVEPSYSLLREILLAKFSLTDIDAKKLEADITEAGAKIIDRTFGTLLAELSGSPEEIDGFLEKLREYKIIELCRSGATAMERGPVSYNLNDSTSKTK